jgi:hypothetical protein
MFGSGTSAGTQDAYFDWVRYCTTGDLPPGQGDAGGIVPVMAVLPPCISEIVDRGTLTVPALPFYHYSETDNQVRFSVADLDGTGDFDYDRHSDLSEFLASTDAKDRSNVFEITGVRRTSAGAVTVEWKSVPGGATASRRATHYRPPHR